MYEIVARLATQSFMHGVGWRVRMRPVPEASNAGCFATQRLSRRAADTIPGASALDFTSQEQ